MSLASDTELVKIRNALDEAPGDLSDLPIKLVRIQDIIRDGSHFYLPKLIRSLAIFLRDEFLARVRPLINDEDVSRNLHCA